MAMKPRLKRATLTIVQHGLRGNSGRRAPYHAGKSRLN